MKALRADPLSLEKIFSGREFIIPDFQRPYSWGIEECEQLWIDISSFIDEHLNDVRDDKEQYFLGSIVVYPHEENKNAWVVIDGQQRLTTLLILIRLLFKHNSTYTVLQKMFYKTDHKTTDIIEDPRLKSEVLAGDGRNDYEDFRKVMELNVDDMDKNNPYKLNHDVVAEKLDAWWNSKTVEQRELALKRFQENIVLLPIECDSLNDALTLFQTINDRGMSLNDADIFKADIYRMSKTQDRESFIKRWHALDDHETLFRIHMHIIRAKAGDIGKEIGLRPYIQRYFNTLENPREDWNSIVSSLEGYHKIRTQGVVGSDEFTCDANMFWAILNQYPNIYWGYPLYVYLNKYGKQKDGCFYLDDGRKQNDYIDLLKNTIRYFYIKGVVYNTVNRVRDTTFKACVAIAHEENYIEKYQENIKDDFDDFFRRLSENDYGYRYQKGLVWLCSSLNCDQNRKDYAETIARCHVEHILPWSWANYDGWNAESHADNIEKIGNKIPLEWKINIQAGNEFFERKQKRYEKSKIRDALDLSKRDSASWKPEDLKERQKVSLNRLGKFFEGSW